MTIRILTIATLTTALAACSSVPERNLALEQAQDRYAVASSDATVQSLAAEELRRAGESLRMAQQAGADRLPRATVDHLAYMTTQRVVIAQETASNRASQAVISAAAAEREKMQMDSRMREADGAYERLARSERDRQLSDARVDELENQLRELNARQTPRGLVVTLGDVLFDSGHAELVAGSAGKMSALAEVFIRHPQLTASVEGYADSSGSASRNVILSRQRAEAVKEALVSLGVAAERLSTEAYGEEGPVASNGTAAGRQLNRRVEIVFTNPRYDRSMR